MHKVNNRDRSVDVLKGIGIIMVVSGHIDFAGIGSSFVSYLYTFNVAIFFFVSGLLWKSQSIKYFPTFLRSKTKTILVPYLVFFCISIFYGFVVVKRVFNEFVIPFNIGDVSKALLYGSEWLNSVPTFNFALWFLPIFFISNCCFFLLQQIKSRLLFGIVLLSLVIVSIPVQALIPGRPVLSINVLPVSLVLMGAGYVWSKWLGNPRISLGILSIMLIFSLWVTASYPGNISGINSYWFFPSAIVSILIYFRIAQDFKSSLLLRFLGIESLYIYGLHGLVANMYRFTPVQQFFANYWSGLMLWLVNLLFVIAVSSALVILARGTIAAARSLRKQLYNSGIN